MKATVTTYRTAKKYDVDAAIREIAEMLAENGDTLSKPAMNDIGVCWMVDGEAADNLDIVKVTCDCGNEFGELIHGDDASSLSWIECPNCGRYTQEYEYNDKISFRRICK